MDEPDALPRLLWQLEAQTFRNFTVYICVNQPDDWWHDDNDAHLQVCIHNADTLRLLAYSENIILLDHCSEGRGWPLRKSGVGYARQALFKAIQAHATLDELVVSLDADTLIAPCYLQQVLDSMNAHPEAHALAVPYYHPVPDEETCARSLLRYECYMRHYFLSLLLIGSPYAFSALGSAMVFPLWSYNRVGGITPLPAGEDFYLMQKFAKTGSLLLSTPALVFPQGRPSPRVPFGTGPAVLTTIAQQQQRYPFYPAEAFQAVEKTIQKFPQLFLEDIPTPMTPFLQQQLRTSDIWGPLRRNFKHQEQFIHACHERVDGLRILQFMKGFPTSDCNLLKFLQQQGKTVPSHLDFATSPLPELVSVRDTLFRLDQALRRQLG